MSLTKPEQLLRIGGQRRKLKTRAKVVSLGKRHHLHLHQHVQREVNRPEQHGLRRRRCSLRRVL